MLTTLRQIIQEVASAQDFKEALTIMVGRITKALDTQACSIFLLDRRHGEYVLMATKGLNPKAVGKIRIPINKGLIGLIGEREEPLNIDDASKHPHFLHVAEAKEEAFKAFLGVPIIYHQQDPRRYDESEEAFLVTLATQLASIIPHAEATGALNELLESSKNKAYTLTLSGIPSAPGIGIGTGAVVYTPFDLDSIPDHAPESIETEIELLDYAFSAVREDLHSLGERLFPSLPPEERALFDVYQQILSSPELLDEIKSAIRQNNWAPGALREILQLHIRRLESLE